MPAPVACYAAAGRWLSLFYTAIPVGTAVGYVYGAMFATSELGWAWAFYVEAAIMLPIAVGSFFLPFKWRPEKPVAFAQDEEEEEDGLLTRELLAPVGRWQRNRPPCGWKSPCMCV